MSDVTATIGQYMLRGWILTDRSCPKPACNCPIMRSPAAIQPETHFCAACDGGPKSQTSSAIAFQAAPSASSNSTKSRASTSEFQDRSETPITDVPSNLSSPTFTIPTITPEMMQRRAQSDRASSEIGKRLLKGWAMLGDECPNDTCYGIPLVRPPKPGGGKDPRKECVICGKVYVSDDGADGYSQLRAISSLHTLETVAPTPAAPISAPETANGVARHQTLDTSNDSPIVVSPALPMEPSKPSTSTSTSLTALISSAQSLESTLHTLSDRLILLTSGNTLKIDPVAISTTAEAISKVTHALGEVKGLMWVENQVAAS